MGALTADEQHAMHSLSDVRLRQNYDLARAQIRMAHDQGNDRALAVLQEWEGHYLDERVRRGIR